MKKILVIGASGFAGRHVSKALLTEGYEVRCLARNLAKVKDLAEAGCETVQGDVSDRASMERAFDSVDAAYISIHTLSPQPASQAGQGFMDVELKGLENILAACKTKGVRRLIYVTFLGVEPDSSNSWVRGRWKAEQLLLNSGLDVTVIRPGQIVGIGGHGFDMMVSQAKRSTALVLGSGRHKGRNIAVDDLAYYLVGVLGDPRTYGKAYDVGCDDVLTYDQMIDVAADVLGRPHPRKIHLPRKFVAAFGPVIERMAKLSKGAVQGFLGGEEADLVGDPRPIRKILPRPPISYPEAVKAALNDRS